MTRNVSAAREVLNPILDPACVGKMDNLLHGDSSLADAIQDVYVAAVRAHVGMSSCSSPKSPEVDTRKLYYGFIAHPDAAPFIEAGEAILAEGRERAPCDLIPNYFQEVLERASGVKLLSIDVPPEPIQSVAAAVALVAQHTLAFEKFEPICATEMLSGDSEGRVLAQYVLSQACQPERSKADALILRVMEKFIQQSVGTLIDYKVQAVGCGKLIDGSSQDRELGEFVDLAASVLKQVNPNSDRDTLLEIFENLRAAGELPQVFDRRFRRDTDRLKGAARVVLNTHKTDSARRLIPPNATPISLEEFKKALQAQSNRMQSEISKLTGIIVQRGGSHNSRSVRRDAARRLPDQRAAAFNGEIKKITISDVESPNDLKRLMRAGKRTIRQDELDELFERIHQAFEFMAGNKVPGISVPDIRKLAADDTGKKYRLRIGKRRVIYTVEDGQFTIDEIFVKEDTGYLRRR